MLCQLCPFGQARQAPSKPLCRTNSRDLAAFEALNGGTVRYSSRQQVHFSFGERHPSSSIPPSVVGYISLWKPSQQCSAQVCVEHCGMWRLDFDLRSATGSVATA